MTRLVVDLARSNPAEGAFDRLERVDRSEQRADFGFGQIERHGWESRNRSSE